MFSDWSLYFWPQIVAPWTLTRGVFNLPWLFVLLQVIRPLGRWGALAVVQVVGLYVTLKLGKSLRLAPWRMVLVVFSPPIAQCFLMGQFDGVFLSAYLHPILAVFMALAKPQVAICAGVAIGLRNKWAALFGIGLILSAYLIWGWPVSCLGIVNERLSPIGEWSCTWNYSPWPWGLLLLPLFFGGRRARLFLSPFLFPYAGAQSFIGPLLSIAHLPAWVLIPVWMAAWMRWVAMITA